MNVLTAEHLAAKEISMSNIAIDVEKTPAAAAQPSEPETKSKKSAKGTKPAGKKAKPAAKKAKAAKKARSAGKKGPAAAAQQ